MPLTKDKILDDSVPDGYEGMINADDVREAVQELKGRCYKYWQQFADENNHAPMDAGILRIIDEVFAAFKEG